MSLNTSILTSPFTSRHMTSSHYFIHIHEAWHWAASLSACGPQPKPQSAWLLCPDLDRSPAGHIRAKHTAANGAVVNGPASVWGPGSTEAQGPTALIIRPQSHLPTTGCNLRPGRRLWCHPDRPSKQSLLSSSTQE